MCLRGPEKDVLVKYSRINSFVVNIVQYEVEKINPRIMFVLNYCDNSKYFEIT